MEINQTNKNSILFISVRADFGGGPQQLYRTVLAIQNEYNIYVACPDSKPYFELLADVVGEERIIRIPHRSFNLFSFLKLLKTIRLKNIDLIHSHGKGAGLYSRLLSKLTAVPCVHTFHGIHIGNYGFLKRFLYIFLEKKLSSFSQALICVSKTELEWLISLNIGTKENRILIENGVPIPKSANRTEADIVGALEVLSVTREDFAKNPDLLIQIAKYLKKANLRQKICIVTVGITNPPEFLRKTELEGVEDFFRVYLPQPDLSSFYQRAFCFLSTSRWEAFGLAVVESMSYGCPVVASNVPGNRDTVQDSVTGFLFPPENADIAAQQITELVKNINLWQEMSNASVERARKYFSLEKMTEKYCHFYNKILKSD